MKLFKKIPLELRKTCDLSSSVFITPGFQWPSIFLTPETFSICARLYENKAFIKTEPGDSPEFLNSQAIIPQQHISMHALLVCILSPPPPPFLPNIMRCSFVCPSIWNLFYDLTKRAVMDLVRNHCNVLILLCMNQLEFYVQTLPCLLEAEEWPSSVQTRHPPCALKV